MDWSNDLILQFLELYKREESIWDPKNRDHKDKTYVNQAWVNIRNGMSEDISVQDLKKKKESLMASYRSLQHKVYESTLTGVIYKPSWFCYELMYSFLKNVYRPHRSFKPLPQLPTPPCSKDDSVCVIVKDEVSCGSTNTIDSLTNGEEEISNLATSFSENTEMEPVHASTYQPAAYQSDTYQGRKRRIPAASPESSQQDQNEKFDTKNRDELDMYVELLASKLRKLDERTRDVVMNDIDNLIFRAKMGQTQQIYPTVQKVEDPLSFNQT